MNWLRNLKIGTKLLLGFATMIVFMGLIGLTGYQSTAKIQKQINLLFTEMLPSLDYLLQILVFSGVACHHLK